MSGYGLHMVKGLDEHKVKGREGFSQVVGWFGLGLAKRLRAGFGGFQIKGL